MAAIEQRIRRIERFRQLMRVPRVVILDRGNPLEYLSVHEVRDRYRFYPESIYFILNEIFDVLDTPTRRSAPLPPLLCLLVTLMFFASGAHYIVISDIHNVSVSSVCRAVTKTTAAIARLLSRYVKMPTDDRVAAVQREFYNIARFPQIVGAIDCTHVTIQAPCVNENDFVNRKGGYSINVQAVCDAQFRITNFVARWPGSVHDSRIFNNSELCRQFETGGVRGILLGDSGYACRNYLLTPYLRPGTQVQERYNNALTRTRVLIEQTFGILKRRFPCLRYGIRRSPENACKTAAACAVLHNIGLERGDMYCRATDVDLAPPEHGVPGAAQAGLRYRDVFAETYFG